HDGHTTMLLGAARYLSETRNFSGRAVLIFQPAEETIGGGRIMVEEGMMDRFGIDEVYAIHTDPFSEAGQLRTCVGPIMAAVEDWTLTVTGVGGHAAYPQATCDSIPAALAIGQALQTIVARETDTMAPLVVSLTQIHAGEAFNVIPDTVTLGGTVRCFDDALMARVMGRIDTIARQVAEGYGVTARMTRIPGYPATINDAEQAHFAAETARDVTPDVIDDLKPEMGSEDFSFMLRARAGAFVFLGQGIGPSVHHPKFDFNDAVAPVGASFLARLVERRNPVAQG
ncbi:MAG: amidohydrolase, partial [Primorskyibacter sp.]